MEKWRKISYDWIDCLNFIFNRNAEVTDGLLTPEEMEKIQEINEITFAHWVGDGMPYASDEPDKKLKSPTIGIFQLLTITLRTR